MATPTLATAQRNRDLSRLIAHRAVTEARKAQPRGAAAVASTVATYQLANAQTSNAAVVDMLAEQAIAVSVDALLNVPAFTTSPESVQAMLAALERNADALLDRSQIPAYREAGFDRLVEALVQDAGRAAEQAAVTARPNVYHVRFLTPPSCSRCAVLAGRSYRWSEHFLRHPGCDCTMIPTTVANPYVQDVDALIRAGQVTGLSKADRAALGEGADLGQVVNVRRRAEGLSRSGETLTRAGRLTPAAIYDQAGEDRAEALRLLRQYGYLL